MEIKWGKCLSTDCCKTLVAKKAAWVALVAARNRLHKRCFSGGDQGHQWVKGTLFLLFNLLITAVMTK